MSGLGCVDSFVCISLSSMHPHAHIFPFLYPCSSWQRKGCGNVCTWGALKKVADIILVLAFPNIRVLAIVAKFKTDTLDAVFNLWKSQKKKKSWLKTKSGNPITKHQTETWVSSTGSQQHRNVYHLSFLDKLVKLF